MQGFLDTERSYTNAFHKTLSLFVDDKTFSTPSLRAAVVGFLEVRWGRSSPSKFRAISDAFHFVLIPGSFRSRNRCTPPPIVGYQSSNATVLETIPNYENERVPTHVRQEIENHVNLVKTVLQRGGVFAEDFLRSESLN